MLRNFGVFVYCFLFSSMFCNFFLASQYSLEYLLNIFDVLIFSLVIQPRYVRSPAAVASSPNKIPFSAWDSCFFMDSYSGLFSIVVFYYKEIFNYFRDIKELLKITQLIIVGVLPAAAVGLLLPIEELIDSSRFILIITFVSYCFLASILIFIEKFDEGQKTLSDLTLKNALYIGLAQSLALLPGISRSGITLATAISLKVKKTEAIFFSLLLGIPTIFGAWVLTFLQSDNQIETSFLLPVVVAFISGLLAIKILINFTVNSKLQIFAKYCLFMGILSLVTYLVNL